MSRSPFVERAYTDIGAVEINTTANKNENIFRMTVLLVLFGDLAVLDFLTIACNCFLPNLCRILFWEILRAGIKNDGKKS